jgi:hypothetical protein
MCIRYNHLQLLLMTLIHYCCLCALVFNKLTALRVWLTNNRETNTNQTQKVSSPWLWLCGWACASGGTKEEHTGAFGSALRWGSPANACPCRPVRTQSWKRDRESGRKGSAHKGSHQMESSPSPAWHSSNADSYFSMESNLTQWR